MKLGLEGKIASISGGCKGIGNAILNILESEGVTCYSLCKCNGFNLMKPDGLNKAKVFVRDSDILINNVGGMGTCEFKDYLPCMEKNYGIMAQLTNEFIQQPRKWGRVITIASMYGKERGHNPWFAASKAAQIAYMKSMAGKYDLITFNTISPGHIDTGKEFPDNPEIIGRPFDIAYLVAFLCSDMAIHINGANIPCDGGVSHAY